MKKFKLLITTIFIINAALLSAADISISSRLGYSPAVGGAMSSGWQYANLDVADGINDINRSADGFAVSSVEAPVGVIAGIDLCITKNIIYYKAGIEYVYVISGGKGKTLNSAGTEVVEVTYSQWSFDVPLTLGISLQFWGETRIYLGGGAAFAFGNYSNSFKSASLNNSASFTTYAIPLVAEIGCEYPLTDKITIGCEIKYFNGKSAVVNSGTDYAKIDFSGFHITASAAYHFDI